MRAKNVSPRQIHDGRRSTSFTRLVFDDIAAGLVIKPVFRLHSKYMRIAPTIIFAICFQSLPALTQVILPSPFPDTLWPCTNGIKLWQFFHKVLDRRCHCEGHPPTFTGLSLKNRLGGHPSQRRSK